MALLDQIDDPKDLKSLDQKQLVLLAEEVRQFILEHVASTGGHLASNLGVVELTIALHYVYDSPYDKIVWDVGHQSYVHKILTSRRSRFDTLRQKGGLSGFPKRAESRHDIFETGHSSTSVSAALGIARARDIKKENYNVLAVIGDGALTGGMAFEALNDAGHLNTNLTVILNDNEMSIAPNVGAMAGYLSKMRSNPRYKHLKKVVEQILRGLPIGGHWIADKVETLKNSFKYLLVPGVLFEELGFTYLGPVDGHDLPLLISILNRAKEVQGPALIHVVTRKGKGYSFSEQNPALYHGVSPFDPEVGCVSGSSTCMTYSQTLGSHLTELARTNPAITAITAAMPDGTGLTPFQEQFPDRFFDVGIAEQHAVTFAAGLAVNGMRPVVAVYSTFLQRAYDQILHDVCRQNLPVIFAIDRAGLVGEDGDTHQGVFDLSYLRHIPNITVMAPKNTTELRHMLDYSLELECPVAIRYPKGYNRKMEELPSFPLQSLEWELLEEGRGIALIAEGSMLEAALQAAQILKEQGIYPAIVNARIIKPLDTNMLDQFVHKNCRIWVTLEDNTIEGGFGSSVNEYAMGYEEEVKVLNMGIPDKFIEHGSVQELKKELGLDPAGIAVKIISLLGKENACAGFPKRTY